MSTCACCLNVNAKIRTSCAPPLWTGTGPRGFVTSRARRTCFPSIFIQMRSLPPDPPGRRSSRTCKKKHCRFIDNTSAMDDLPATYRIFVRNQLQAPTASRCNSALAVPSTGGMEAAADRGLARLLASSLASPAPPSRVCSISNIAALTRPPSKCWYRSHAL